MENIDDLFGDDEPAKTVVKGAKQRALERKQQAIKIAESAARIMQDSKLNKTRKSIEDLMGDTNEDTKEVKEEKKAAKKAAKATKAEKTAKSTKAEKPAKGKKANSGERGTRGSGKFYFPEAGDERKALCKKVLAKVKAKVSTVELAKQLEEQSWKVRLVVKQLAREKQLKVGKDGSRTVAMPK